MASTSTASSGPTPAQLTLFARTILATLRLWPALRLALQTPDHAPSSASSSAGGGAGGQNLQLFASEILELFEGGKAPGEDDLEGLLLQVMDEEFDTLVEDDSALPIAKALILAWQNLASPEAEESVRLLEEKADKASKTRLKVERREEVEEVDEDGNGEWEDEEDDEGEDEDGDVKMDDEAPTLVERAPKPEPVVDDEGFTLVQKKGRR